MIGSGVPRCQEPVSLHGVEARAAATPPHKWKHSFPLTTSSSAPYLSSSSSLPAATASSAVSDLRYVSAEKLTVQQELPIAGVDEPTSSSVVYMAPATNTHNFELVCTLDVCFCICVLTLCPQTTFHVPTYCGVCNQFIWGISKQVALREIYHFFHFYRIRTCISWTHAHSISLPSTGIPLRLFQDDGARIMLAPRQRVLFRS